MTRPDSWITSDLFSEFSQVKRGLKILFFPLPIVQALINLHSPVNQITLKNFHSPPIFTSPYFRSPGVLWNKLCFFLFPTSPFPFLLCAVYWCSNLWNPSRINCRANIKVSWTHLFSIPVSFLLPMKLVTQSEDSSHSWPHSWDTRTCFKAPPPTVLLSKVCRPLLCQGIKRKKTTMCSAVNTLAISAFPQLLLLTNYS